MIPLTQKQKQLLAEFLSNTAVTFITVGGIAPIFTSQEFDQKAIIKFILSLVITMILLIISLRIIKK